MKATVSPFPASRWTPVTISDHELLRPIASGSYGEVWLARNAVKTSRAVKIVRRDYFERAEDFEREFRGLQNFEPVSRSHDGFVDILQIGRQDDWFYYVMELADDGSESRLQPANVDEEPVYLNLLSPDRLKAGLQTYAPRTLRHDLRTRGALTADEVIGLGLGLTSALAHLHGQGLVHRDVKPSNILFVGGVPKLADAGLVAAMDDARSLVGTAGYIAPEGPGTPQADIYALGKVLYEAAFGKDRQDFPQLPSDLASRPDHRRLLELNEIIVRACAHDLRQRYESTEEMRTDFGRLQRGQSVQEHYAWQKRLRAAHRIALGTAAVILGSILILLTSRPHQDRLSKDPLAKKEYLEGVQCARRHNKEGLTQALAHFTNAIAIDPKFTMAYNGLFEVYLGGEQLELSGAEQWANMRASASKLLAMDSKLAEAQAGQAWLDFLDWKWNQAEPRFRKAIQLDPKCAIAHMRYGFCLVHAGRPDEGHKKLLIAESLDPTPKVKKNIGHVFYVKRQFREAIEQYQRATNLEPNYPNPHFFIGCAYRALGNYTNAIDEFEKHDILSGKDPAQVKKHFDALREAYARGGPQSYWLKYLKDAQDEGDLRGQARCHAKLEDYDRALILLDQFYATNQPESLEFLLFDECWEPVKADPRFITLLRKVGLKV